MLEILPECTITCKIEVLNRKLPLRIVFDYDNEVAEASAKLAAQVMKKRPQTAKVRTFTKEIRNRDLQVFCSSEYKEPGSGNCT